MNVSPVTRIVGILSSYSFVSGNRYGNESPYVRLSHCADETQSGSIRISPFPSEFAEIVNSLSSVDERTLFRLMAPVGFGRDHDTCARSKLPTKGSLKCHGICVARTVSRWFGVIR